MTISQRIFSLLEEKHLSQKDLSQYAGLSPAAISGWKKKGTSPSSDKLIKISEFLGVSVTYLLTGMEPPIPQSDFIMDSQSDNYESGLTETEESVLQMFRRLSDFEKGRIIGILEHSTRQMTDEK